MTYVFYLCPYTPNIGTIIVRHLSQIKEWITYYVNKTRLTQGMVVVGLTLRQ